MALAKNVITYTMLADGIPTIYQGQELHYQAYGGQTYPYNREAIWSSGFPEDGELYIATKSLNAARKNAARDDSAYLTSQNFPLDQGTGWLAMRKGKMVTVLNNFGADGADGGDYDQTVKAQYNAGEQVTEMLGCTTLTAGSDGSLAVPMSSGQPRVFYPSAGIGSLCSNATRVLARSAKWRHM
jgi:alpha-amylase